MLKSKILFITAFIGLFLLTAYSPSIESEEQDFSQLQEQYCITSIYDRNAIDTLRKAFVVKKGNVVTIVEELSGEPFYQKSLPAYSGSINKDGKYYVSITDYDGAYVVFYFTGLQKTYCDLTRALGRDDIEVGDGGDETSQNGGVSTTRPSGCPVGTFLCEHLDSKNGYLNDRDICCPQIKNDKKQDCFNVPPTSDGDSKGFVGVPRCNNKCEESYSPIRGQIKCINENINHWVCCDKALENCVVPSDGILICELKTCQQIKDEFGNENQDLEIRKSAIELCRRLGCIATIKKIPRDSIPTGRFFVPTGLGCTGPALFPIVPGGDGQVEVLDQCVQPPPCDNDEKLCKNKLNSRTGVRETGDRCCKANEEIWYYGNGCECRRQCELPKIKCPENGLMEFTLYSLDAGPIRIEDFTCCNPASEECVANKIQGYTDPNPEKKDGAPVCKPKPCSEINADFNKGITVEQAKKACEERSDCQAKYREIGTVDNRPWLVYDGCGPKSGQSDNKNPPVTSPCPEGMKLNPESGKCKCKDWKKFACKNNAGEKWCCIKVVHASCGDQKGECHTTWYFHDKEHRTLPSEEV